VLHHLPGLDVRARVEATVVYLGRDPGIEAVAVERRDGTGPRPPGA
jgi:hypothetical protein